MKWRNAALCALSGYAAAACASAAPPVDPPTTQAEAFNQGKAYKPANAAIKSGITPSALADVPGQDAATTNELKGLYGAPLKAPGEAKLLTCAGYVPGSDAMKNQECDTINYVAGNPAARPVYTIDKTSDPLIIRSSNVRNTAEAHTAGTSGLSGSYTACTSKTTSLPERFDTERCQVGRPVTEARCSVALKVTYTWQRYNGQAGADLRYGRCSTGLVRGDKLTIPLHNNYRVEWTACSVRGHGAGTEMLIWHDDCGGASTLHGYDASACSIKPVPEKLDPPRQPIGSCTTAPRIDQNCFTPGGQFVEKAEVPVFKDTWDYASCTDLDAHRADIEN